VSGKFAANGSEKSQTFYNLYQVLKNALFSLLFAVSTASNSRLWLD
jgi:hypothetical protein